MVDKITESIRQNGTANHKAVCRAGFKPRLHGVCDVYWCPYKHAFWGRSAQRQLTQRQMLCACHMFEPVRGTFPTVASKVPKLRKRDIQLELDKVQVIEIPAQVIQGITDVD